MSDPRSPGSDRQDPSGSSAGDERLVLTPALRVPVADRPASTEPAADAAMLRRLLRDILDEELRGEFGGRITREMRKLVRAEVRALLAARDQD